MSSTWGKFCPWLQTADRTEGSHPPGVRCVLGYRQLIGQKGVIYLGGGVSLVIDICLDRRVSSTWGEVCPWLQTADRTEGSHPPGVSFVLGYRQLTGQKGLIHLG